MTVGELVKYLECIPSDDIRSMKIMLRVPSTTGQYTQLVNPVKVRDEVLPHHSNEERIIVIDTWYAEER